MVSYFKPQNPTNAVVINSYDSLNRISSQLDINGNTRSFYLAGSRSELVDPALNSAICYYDSEGNVLTWIDELGYTTAFQYDGLGRTVQKTLPEGNVTEWTYDANNNVLTKTLIPKPTSTLANIVNTYTYDPTYNKVHTFVDGKSQTTTSNYDPATGNLLNVQKPQVAGITPTLTYTYNARGQILTSTDESGVLTFNTYSITNETLLTQVVDYSTGSGHLNLTTTYGYDTVGNITSLENPLNNTTTFFSTRLVG